MPKHIERFQTGGSRYSQFRPHYPDAIIRIVAERLMAAPAPATHPVLDVGSGTGIFARQLAAALPSGIPILGIEPSVDMRKQAALETPLPSVAYRDGMAERLLIEDSGARGVLAATAAHWFDRDAFYREASRVLPEGGVLGIVEYVRDETSPAARAVIDFLNRFGEARAYSRPDYMQEIGRLAGFHEPEQVQERVTLLLAPSEFAGLALSSSHARTIIEAVGSASATAQLEAIGSELANETAKVPFGYIFQAALAKRA